MRHRLVSLSFAFILAGATGTFTSSICYYVIGGTSLWAFLASVGTFSAVCVGVSLERLRILAERDAQERAKAWLAGRILPQDKDG